MKLQKLKLVLLLCCACLCLQSAAAKQTPNSQSDFQLLRKKVDAPVTAASGSLEITLRFNGLQTGDFVNIRPKGNNLEVAGGIVSKERSNGLQSAGRLPDSSVVLSPTTLTFTRSALFKDAVFLDILVPTTARVQVLAEEKVVLNATLAGPIGFRNGELREGALGIPGAIVRAAGASSENSVEQLASGLYSVPASKLQVIKQTSSPTRLGRDVAVGVEIDEQGRVVRAKVLNGDLSVNVEGSVREWRFAPYLVDGQPVRVATILKLRL